MDFRYKGENVVVEFNPDASIKWVYAYNMRMTLNVAPYDLKQEIAYLLTKANIKHQFKRA